MIRKPRTEKNFTPEGGETLISNAACLNRIFKKVEIEGLSEDAAIELADDLRFISERFAVSSKAAVLLAAILEKSNSNFCCGEDDLANYIGCTNIEFYDFHEAIRELEDRCIISASSGRSRGKMFCATHETVKAIEDNEAFIPVKISGLTTDELFSRLRMLIGEYRRDNIDADKLISEETRLMENNRQLLFCRKALESELYSMCSDTEKRIFYYLCNRYVCHGEQDVPVNILMYFTEYMEDESRLRRCIANGKTTLQQCGFVTFGNDDGFNNEQTLSLSGDVRNNWFDEIELAPMVKVNHKNIIRCDTIKEQELFYNAEEGEQVARLEALLQDENYRNVRERLESEGMPKGFCAVFHGCPGSGKTASLKALAKKTGRDLFWVDLSSIKSCWVGESEKNIQKLFNSYRELVKTSEKAPILAINEADGIFTKRITNIQHSVDNMYNSMTDIVLNEMETLDGILIATTNLAGNMMDEKDNAMERRFLFKIEFNTPCEDVRAKIWKSKIKSLSDESAAILAKRFTFSGGNIENIARKCTLDYVLSGKHPELETITRYCDEELISGKKKSGRIGFEMLNS